MIYFIGIEGRSLIKVGRAGDPKKRLANLAVAQPFSLELLHTIKAHDDSILEKQIHKFLAKYHVRGEWFRITRAQASAAVRHFEQRLQFSSNPVIDEVIYLASKIETVNGNLQTVTQPCFFCGKKHLHGAIDTVRVEVDGLQSYGHRVAHCGEHIIQSLHGNLIDNAKGYYLWIRDREAEARNRHRLKRVAKWVADPEYYYVSA